MLRRLLERLAPGGCVLIIDWLPSQRSGAGAGHEHGHSHSQGLGHHDHGHHHHHHHGAHTAPEPDSEDEMKPMRHTIAHDGFDEAKMRSLFEEAGLRDFGFVTLDEPLTLCFGGKSVEKTAFMARGRTAGPG